MIQALLTLTLGVAMPAQDPPQSPLAFNRKVTVRFIEKDGTEKFAPLTNQKAKLLTNKSGDPLWVFELTPSHRTMHAGDLVVDEAGAVWVVKRVGNSSGKTVVTEKQPKPD